MSEFQNESPYAVISHHNDGNEKNCGYKKSSKKDKVWIEDPTQLAKDITIIPKSDMTHVQKFNTITRLVIVIFIVMFALKYKHSLNFLCLALIIILILYFTTNKEYYQMDQPPKYKYPLINQNSKAMMKLSTAPIMVPPIADREVWSYPSHTNSATNSRNQFDITEQYAEVPERNDSTDIFDPRLATYTNFSLQTWGDPKSAVIQNTEPVPQSNNPYGYGYIDPSTDSQNNYGQGPYAPNLYGYAVESNLNNSSIVPQTNTGGPVTEGFGMVFSDSTPISNVAPNVNQRHYQRGAQYVDNNFATIPKGTEDNYLPNQNLLIPKTITSIYGRDQVTRPERMKYFTSIGPQENFYNETTTPINANIGISYNPDLPPTVLDQTVTPIGEVVPLFHSIDPQLIRDGGLSDIRKAQLPRRTAWSAKYSGFEAQDGTVNFEDIYDPRFNGYGDPYRSYQDVNAGNINYYYSDLDRFRDPNFGGRSKVDFIDYTDPMGKTIPEYDRQVGLNDIKQTVHSQYDADAVYQREDLMSKLMRKRNSELWQLRKMPHRKDSHASSFTSGY